MKYAALILVIGCTALACGIGGDSASPPPQPATGPGTFTTDDGLTIAYTVYGGGSPALVFIHGWMCDQSFWAEQVEHFASGATVVTLDLGGHGKTVGEREGWPLDSLPGDVAAVVEHLDLHDVILIGHSMGGPVALDASRLLPGRVIGIVAIDTLHNVDTTYDAEQMNQFMTALEADFPTTCGVFVASMFPEDADDALFERVNQAMCQGPKEVGLALMRQFFAYDRKASLAAVDLPVRAINSTMWPTNVEANRAVHADYGVTTMDGVGHFLMMEAPEEFNGRLDEIIAELIAK